MDEQEARETLEIAGRIQCMVIRGEMENRYVDWQRLANDVGKAEQVLAAPPQQPRSAAGRVVLVGRIQV
jgi:hypothetical protein